MVGNQEKRGGGSREERGDLDDWVYIPHIRSYEISIYVCIVVCSVVYLHLGILRKRGRGERREGEGGTKGNEGLLWGLERFKERNKDCVRIQRIVIKQGNIIKEC